MFKSVVILISIMLKSTNFNHHYYDRHHQTTNSNTNQSHFLMRRDQPSSTFQQHTQQSHIESTFTFNNNVLTKLLEADMWLEAYQHCLDNPHECVPILSHSKNQSKIYAYTPLGIACRKFTSEMIVLPTDSEDEDQDDDNFNDESNSNNTQSMISQWEIIQTLYKACPSQLQCNQTKIGLTPLLDIISNQHADEMVVKFFIHADKESMTTRCNNNHDHFVDMNISETTAIGRRDHNGLLPIHHLMNQLYRNYGTNNNLNNGESKALHLIEYIVDLYPSFLNTTQPSTEEENNHKRLQSPLIHLLSHKVGKHWEDPIMMSRVNTCVEIFLSRNPNLILTKSVMTSCTPLHMMLKNGFGDNTYLITLLLRYDSNGFQVTQKNLHGDLPVHVAATVGVDKSTWNVLLEHISNVSTMCSSNSYDPIDGPSPYIWSINKYGLTPLHLQWMRQVNGQVHYPWSYTRNNQNHQQQGLYYDSLQAEVNKTISEVNEQSRINHNVDKIVSGTLGEFWDILKLMLRRNHHPSSNDETLNFDCFLHAVCSLIGPLLPYPVFHLILNLFGHQANEMDVFGRYPLHYACATFSMNKQFLVLTTPSKSIGWYEVGLETQTHGNDSSKNQCAFEQILSHNNNAAAKSDINGYFPLHFALRTKGFSGMLKENWNSYQQWCANRTDGHCVIDWTCSVKKVAGAYPECTYEYEFVFSFICCIIKNKMITFNYFLLLKC